MNVLNLLFYMYLQFTERDKYNYYLTFNLLGNLLFTFILSGIFALNFENINEWTQNKYNFSDRLMPCPKNSMCQYQYWWIHCDYS